MRSPRWIRILACLIPMTLSAAACAGSSTSDDELTPRPIYRPVITITNDHWYPVNVYHVNGGTRFRLGTVSTMRSETFRMPDDVQAGGVLRLLLDPVGSGNAYLTEQIVVGAGQSVFFRVQTRLAASSWFIR